MGAGSTTAKELLTYSRRTKAKAASLAEAAEDYINYVAVEIPTVLLTPMGLSRRAQNVPISAPRCSRRVAKLPPEFDLQGRPLVASSVNAPNGKLRVAEFDSRARASVAREIGISEEEDQVGKTSTQFFSVTPYVGSMSLPLGLAWARSYLSTCRCRPWLWCLHRPPRCPGLVCHSV